MNFESIDLYSLTLQATAEFNEKAAAAGLDLRIKQPEKAPPIHADGKLMWRIMENLLSNVLRYSQKDSRVYLEVESSGLYGKITIKNISSLPLGSADETLCQGRPVAFGGRIGTGAGNSEKPHRDPGRKAGDHD